MSEAKPEIPAPMLDAATAAMLRAQEFGTGEDEPEYTRENFKRLSLYPAWQRAERYAEVALKAAGVAEMAARIAELEGELAKYRQERKATLEMAKMMFR